MYQVHVGVIELITMQHVNSQVPVQACHALLGAVAQSELRCMIWYEVRCGGKSYGSV